MWGERAVIGEAWSGITGAAVCVADGAEPVGIVSAGAPPGEVASADGAATARIVMLLRNALRARTRKTTTSFVGLRG